MDGETVREDQVDESAENFSNDEETVSTPEKYKLWDGEYTKDDIEAWRQDHENKSKWQKELTQKSQEVGQFRQFAQWWDNPEVPVSEKRKFLEAYLPKEEARAVAEETEGDSDALRELMQKVNSLEQTLTAKEQRDLEDRLVSQLNTAKDMYKDRWNDKHQKMIENIYVAKGGNLLDIAKEYFADLDELFKGHQKQYIEGKKRDLSNPALQGKGGHHPGSESKGISEEERRASLAADLFGGNS